MEEGRLLLWCWEGPKEDGGGGGGALQKVVHGSASGVGVLLVRDSVKLLELAVALVVERQDGGDVSAAVAVVGGRPDGHELLIEHVLVTLLHKLVSTGDELELVLLDKLLMVVVGQKG